MNIHHFLSSFAYFSLERGMGITNILVLKLVQFQKESHHLGGAMVKRQEGTRRRFHVGREYVMVG